MDIVALSGCSTWWNGPEFLLGNKTAWPQQKFELTEKSKLEFKNTFETCIVSVISQTVPHQEIRFQQILKLEKTVKRNWLGQAIHSK